MAESVVTFFLQKLSELITQVNLLTGVDEQITSLHDKLEWINSFLKDADARRKENERVRVWVNQVRDVAYDAEDVIDEFILKVERQRRTAGVVSFRKCFGSINHLKTLHDVRKQIKKIRRRIEEISANKSNYGIDTLHLGEPSSSMNHGFSWQRRRGPVVDDVDVGIEDDANKLVKQLIEGELRLRVISIVGMGGLGKTTLANKVYNRIYVNRHFDCRAWISLSQKYRFREVLMGIIKQVMMLKEEEEKKLEKKDDEEVGEELFKYLKGRRYLVVIDDIWNIEAWDSLETIFPEGSKGSRVMLTTRKKEVALHAKSIPHNLGFLKEGECWVLFCHKAFPNNVTNVLSAEMENIGRKIVAKCGGLPLAVVVLGGFLSRKYQTPNEWEKVLNRVNWQLDEGQNPISRILSLSYDDLPYFLKSCFLYFGVFPEDFEIPAKKLIQLWVAEGLIQQRGNGTIEEVAEDYLEELIGRSMIQVLKRKSNGCIKTCRIHDLLRDLSISEAKEDRFLDIHGNAEFTSPARARRITIHSSVENFMTLNHLNPHLRSLLCFGLISSNQNWGILFKGFKLLRVLDLARVDIHKLPSVIGEMIHLRFLKVHLKWVPSTISNLVNLQTLDLKSHHSSGFGHIITVYTFQELSTVISKMDQLRHLYMCSGRISGRFRIDCLRNLQTLSGIEAGDWIEDGLARLTNLRKLRIERVLDCHKEAISDSIVKLYGLRSLFLNCTGYVTMPTLMLSNHMHLYRLGLFGYLEKLPQLLEFPPNLTNLYLGESFLMHELMETLEKLPHLKILKLYHDAFRGKEMVCAKKGFPQLKELVIEDFSNLEEWKVEEEAMSSLRLLKIGACRKLKLLPSGLQHVTTLLELKLRGISEELKGRIQVENGEDWYKVRHVPLIIICD